MLLSLPNRIKSFVTTLALSTVLAISNSAAAGIDITTFERGYLGGQYEQSIAALNSRLSDDPDNGDAILALGVLNFLHALEGLQRDLYRYGAGNVAGRGESQGHHILRNILPVFRVPVPINPTPEPATYAKTRILIERFVSRLKKADKVLATIKNKEAKVPYSFGKTVFDINADLETRADENIEYLLNQFAKGNGIRLDKSKIKSALFNLDNGDAHWLRGYSNVLMAVGNFFLSFDFENSYDASFHGIFGNHSNAYGREINFLNADKSEMLALRAKVDAYKRESLRVYNKNDQHEHSQLFRKRRKISRDKSLSSQEKQAALAPINAQLAPFLIKQKAATALYNKHRPDVTKLSKMTSNQPPKWAGVLDLVGFIHSVNWPVVEPDRLKMVKQNLMTMAQLNQTTWKSILAETDNDHEWLPNPTQTSPFIKFPVTQDQIDAWLKFMETIEKVLNGELLLPNLRSRQGINLNKFFNEADRFDFVSFFTGPGALKFTQKGKLWDMSSVRSRKGPFGRNYAAYSYWFCCAP